MHANWYKKTHIWTHIAYASKGTRARCVYICLKTHTKYAIIGSRITHACIHITYAPIGTRVMHIGTHVTRASIGTRIMHWIHPISIDWYRKIAYMNPSNICIHQYQNFLVHKIRGAVPYRAFTLTTAGDFSRPVLLNQLFRPSNSKPAPQLSKCSFWRWIYAYQAFPPRTWMKGGQDKSAREKWQVQDVIGTCLI